MTEAIAFVMPRIVHVPAKPSLPTGTASIVRPSDSFTIVDSRAVVGKKRYFASTPASIRVVPRFRLIKLRYGLTLSKSDVGNAANSLFNCGPVRRSDCIDGPNLITFSTAPLSPLVSEAPADSKERTRSEEHT